MIYKRSNNIDDYSDEAEYRNYEKLDNLMIDMKFH